MDTTPTTPTGELGVTLTVNGRVRPNPTALCTFLLDTVDRHQLDPETVTVCTQVVWVYPQDQDGPTETFHDVQITGSRLIPSQPG